ncbi:MAG: hypothetical protein WBP72_17680 [Rhodocyclaceae bacterium]
MKKALLVSLLVGLVSSSAMAYDGAPWRDAAEGERFVPAQYGDSVRAARAEVERARWRLRDDLRDHAPRHVIERDQRRLHRAEERLRWADERRHERRARPHHFYGPR